MIARLKSNFHPPKHRPLSSSSATPQETRKYLGFRQILQLLSRKTYNISFSFSSAVASSPIFPLQYISFVIFSLSL